LNFDCGGPLVLPALRLAANLEVAPLSLFMLTENRAPKFVGAPTNRVLSSFHFFSQPFSSSPAEGAFA